MIIKLYFKGNEYDLSPYIDLSDNNILDTIENQLDSGKIVLPRIKPNAFAGLDLSRRLPTDCLIYYNNEKGLERYYRTGDTECFEVVTDRIYRHEIQLIDLSKILQLTPIRDMTITQPQDGNHFASSSARSVLEINNINETIFNNGAYNSEILLRRFIEIESLNDIGLKIGTGGKTANFNIVDNTNTDIIDGLEIKEDGNFNLSLNIQAYNPTFRTSVDHSIGTFSGSVQRTSQVNPILDVYITRNGIEEKIFSRQLNNPQIVTTESIQSGGGSAPVRVFFRNKVNPVIDSFNVAYSGNFTAGTNLGVVFKIQGGEQWRHSMTNYGMFSREEVPIYFDNFAVVKGLSLTIAKQSEAKLEDEELPIRLGDTVEKIVRLSGLDLIISNSTIERLNKYGTPENTFTRFTAWEALLEVGAVIGARPKIIMNDENKRELIFNYFSDMETDFEVVTPPNIQSVATARSAENYVAGLQLNADNIVSSELTESTPFDSNVEVQTNWMSLRAGGDGTQKITTDNIGIKLPNNIYQMRQVEIKGIDLYKMSNNYEKFSEYTGDYIWKLNEDEEQLRIVEEKYWQTLEEENDYSDLIIRTETKKNNTIYFRQGDNRLYGLNFTAQFKPVLETEPRTEGNRSLYEMIFVKAILKEGLSQAQFDAIKSSLVDPGTTAEDNKIRFRVTYIPQDLTRATIYKEDLSGFELPNTQKYYNETAIVNDPLALGSHTQDTINRLGNTVISYTGYALPNQQLPFVGSKTPDNKILTSITYNDRPYRTEYVANYVQDFSIISDYVGIKSPHRQYEIPKDSVVLALDKNKTHIFVDIEQFSSSTSVWGNNIKEFFDFKAVNSKAPLFAEVSTYLFKNNYDNDLRSALFMRPITKVPTGKTINYKYQMETNYSAGTRKNQTTVDGQEVYWQEEVPYGTKFGRMYGSKVRLVKSVNLSAVDNADNYPMLEPNVVSQVYTDNKYIVDKDAREITGLIEEVSFHSNKVNDIIIYDGITRFNPMVLTDMSRNDVKIAILNEDYKVSKSAKKVDYSKLQAVGGSILNGITYTLFDNRIEFNLPPEANGKGIVIYNDRVDTGDLIMIYLTDITGSGTKTIYFGTKNIGE